MSTHKQLRFSHRLFAFIKTWKQFVWQAWICDLEFVCQAPNATINGSPNIMLVCSKSIHRLSCILEDLEIYSHCLDLQLAVRLAWSQSIEQCQHQYSSKAVTGCVAFHGELEAIRHCLDLSEKYNATICFGQNSHKLSLFSCSFRQMITQHFSWTLSCVNFTSRTVNWPFFRLEFLNCKLFQNLRLHCQLTIQLRQRPQQYHWYASGKKWSLSWTQKKGMSGLREHLPTAACHMQAAPEGACDGAILRRPRLRSFPVTVLRSASNQRPLARWTPAQPIAPRRFPGTSMLGTSTYFVAEAYLARWQMTDTETLFSLFCDKWYHCQTSCEEKEWSAAVVWVNVAVVNSKWPSKQAMPNQFQSCCQSKQCQKEQTSGLFRFRNFSKAVKAFCCFFDHTCRLGDKDSQSGACRLMKTGRVNGILKHYKHDIPFLSQMSVFRSLNILSPRLTKP